MSLVTENTGKAIRTFRKKNKLTVQELADRICKSKATVSKYESGKISLDLDTLFDIAQVLQSASSSYYTCHRKMSQQKL